jgi:DNA-binding PadR family transcriptional regulator
MRQRHHHDRHGRRGHRFGEGLGEGFGRGDRPFRGRKLGAADLQLVILALLAEEPSHGYELIKALEERSGGFYSPSPGMIYPALTYLEEIGHATVEASGTKKLYRISDEGRAFLEQNQKDADTMLRTLERIGGKMERVREALAGDGAADAEDDDPSERGGSDEFRTARRALRQLLREKRHASPEEARRITDILRRATAEIAGQA